MKPVFTDPVMPEKVKPITKSVETGELIEADGSIKDALNSLLIILGGEDNANQSENH